MNEYKGFKTYYPKPDTIERKWYLIDAEGMVLGRLATRIAKILQGKHKPEYYPGADVGDFVIVINVDKLKITGKKLDQKKYYRHSGYPGGLKVIPMRKMMEKFPDRVLRLAVRRMLPKNRFGRRVIKRLKIYAGDSHPHEAQKPVELDINKI